MLRKKLMNKKRKGQSTVEYVILVAAVLAIVIAFVAGNNSPFSKALNSAFSTGATGMNDMADSLSKSHMATNNT
jgi:uncharacterized protein (UPF0333 family)